MERRPAQRTAREVSAELARRNMTHRDLARGLGWTTSYVQRRLTGSTPIDIDELVAIARYLGVPLASLLPTEEHAA